MSMTLIGTVRVKNGFKIVLDERWRKGLVGLAGFSHVVVLWQPHLGQWDDAYLCVPKPYRRAPDQLGIFATRSPIRPNPIALSVAPIADVEVEAGVVQLHWLDAEEGSPVLDLKPYHPSSDRVEKPQLPQWCAHWPGSLEKSADFDWGKEFLFPH